MNCALYLDPRYRTALSNDRDKVEEAHKNLLKLWRRIRVNEAVQIEETDANESSNLSDSFSFEFNEK